MNRFEEFTNSVITNVDGELFKHTTEQLLMIVATRLAGYYLHKEALKQCLYQAAVCLYILVQRHGEDIDLLIMEDESNEVLDLVFAMGVLGDVAFGISGEEERLTAVWPVYAVSILHMLVYCEEFEIAEFRHSPYSSKSIVSP